MIVSRTRRKCPLHGGQSPDSLSIAKTSDGRTLAHCFAGCRYEDLARALGLERPPAGKIHRDEFSPLAAARAEATRRTLRQPWARDEHRLHYELADPIRRRRQRADRLRHAVTLVGDRPDAWEYAAVAANLDRAADQLEMGLEHAFEKSTCKGMWPIYWMEAVAEARRRRAARRGTPR